MIDVDLNLLRVFTVLMELRSVTRAAERLCVTQSAVSHALKRLRHQLDDTLFIRGPGGLLPTARALEIMGDIRAPLQQLNDATSKRHFDEATTEHTFEISAGSYFSAILFPETVRIARREAPRISFRLSPPTARIQTLLDTRQIDIALGSFGSVAERLQKLPLFNEALVWIVSADTLPPGEPITFEDIEDRPRLQVSAGHHRNDNEGVGLGSGLEQQLELSDADLIEPQVIVNDAFSAISLVSASDLVALVPGHIARLEASRRNLTIIKYAAAEPIQLSMVYHSRFDADPAHRWLRELIARVSKGLNTGD